MRPPTRPSAAILALLVASLSRSAIAGAVEGAPDVTNVSYPNDLASETGLAAPVFDCPFAAAHSDPDGRERRASVSRVTRAFAASHPEAGA